MVSDNDIILHRWTGIFLFIYLIVTIKPSTKTGLETWFFTACTLTVKTYWLNYNSALCTPYGSKLLLHIFFSNAPNESDISRFSVDSENFSCEETIISGHQL